MLLDFNCWLGAWFVITIEFIRFDYFPCLVSYVFGDIKYANLA
jgi:hypothetical protein